MRDDAVLLREFATQRSESAFAELVRRHIDAIYSSALRRVGGDSHLAEDVTQQVFAALARKAARLARHPYPLAWLFAATRNEAANAVRAERRRRAREQEAMAMHESSSAPAEPDWRRIAPVLDAAIDQLSEADRTAILLRFVERHGFAEIGAKLQTSEDAARMRVDRALDRLRLALRRHGITSSATVLEVALSNQAVGAAPPALAGSVSDAAILGSAATSTTLLTTLSVMTQSKIAALLATAALLGTFGVATMEFRENCAAAAALVEARSQETAAFARLAAKEREAAAEEAHVAANGKARAQDSANADSTAAIRTAAANADPWNPRAEGLALMERHPEVRTALNAWCDAKTNFDWSGFYVVAGLTAAEIAEFQKLWRERGGLGRELSHTGDGREIELYAGTGLSNAEIEERTRELLGPDRYGQYQTYLRERSAREFAGQLASALAFSAEPLLAGQFDQLKSDLVRRNAFPIGRAGPEYRWDDVMAAARSTLSPVQLAAVEAVRAQTEFNTSWGRAGMALTTNKEKE